MDKAFLQVLYKNHQSYATGPTPEEISLFFTEILGALFAEYAKVSSLSEKEFGEIFEKLKKKLERFLRESPSGSTNPTRTAELFFDSLPLIFEKLQQDITAMFDGDPAAKSRSEVVRTYPGFYAIAAYRVAHELHSIGVKDIPRVITEHAHGKTGVDIHPAALIGNYFFIDHGTGIVIGETTIIGNYVKLYQGVTLGALSTSKSDADKKRHPTIEDNVIIYSGATILGGETVIGQDSIIGGNVWITRTIAPGSKVYYQATMQENNGDQSDVIVIKKK
jgi:serine O-acetyltransferase